MEGYWCRFLCLYICTVFLISCDFKYNVQNNGPTNKKVKYVFLHKIKCLQKGKDETFLDRITLYKRMFNTEFKIYFFSVV